MNLQLLCSGYIALCVDVGILCVKMQSRIYSHGKNNGALPYGYF